MSEEETGSRHMHMFTGQQAEKQHKAGTGLQIRPYLRGGHFPPTSHSGLET